MAKKAEKPTSKKSTIKKKEALKKPLVKMKNESSNLLFNTIFDHVDFGIFLFDEKQNILKVNKQFCKTLGYKEKELYNLPLSKLIHPLDLEKDVKLFADLVKGKRAQYKVEKRYFTKKEKIIFAKVTVCAAQKTGKKIQSFIAFFENISEQKEITSKYEAEQSLLHSLLNNIPDSIYFKDLKSRFIKVNPAMANKHGSKSTNDLIGRSDFELFGDEHANSTYNDEQEIISSERPLISKPEKEDWKDGRVSWVTSTKMPLYDKDGAVIGTFGISRDITKEIENQKRIEESEMLFRSLFENSIDGMLLLTDVVIDCNQTVCDILQYSREELLGLTPYQFSPEFQSDGKASRESAIEKINLTMQGIPQRFEWLHKTKYGLKIETEITLKAITLEGKSFVQAILRDVSQRNRKEKIQKALFDISEFTYTASDMHNLFHKVHQVVGRLMPAKNFYIALYDDKTDMISFPYFVDEYDPPIEAKKAGKGLTEYLIRTGKALLLDAQGDLELRKTGEVELIGAPQAIWLGVPLKVSNKTIGVIVVQDYDNDKAFGDEELSILTFVSEQVAQAMERKKTSDEVKKYAEELKNLNSTKDKFFSIIAHDLKNPFITILGFSDLLLTDYSELTDDERIFYLEEMKKSAEKSHNLLQNLLQWSRSQTGRIEFSPIKLSLASSVRINLELLSSTASRKGITIEQEIPESIIVLADEDMINTVIRNLITNAIKFTGESGKISILSSIKDSFAEVRITDTGVGMDEQTLSNIFRLDVSHTSFGTNHEAGTGLGLILCKEFVERQGGTIWVESQVGKGTTFSFTLPLAN